MLPSGAGPPFRPEQKVKLDKTEAGKGGCFFAWWFLGSDVGTAPLKQKKLEKGTGPVSSMPMPKGQRAILARRDVSRPPDLEWISDGFRD